MLEYLLTRPAPEPTPTVSLDGWAIAALFIGPAVVAAVISGAVTFLALYPASKLRREEAAEVAKRDLNTRALNEFYSPIRELLNEVEILRNEIHRRVNKANVTPWHTLDHIVEIKADKDAWVLYDAMVKVNERIKQLLDEKAGLARGAVTESGLWRVHQSLLARALANPNDVPATELNYFPADFETQINAQFDLLAAQIGAHSEPKKGKAK